MRQVTFVGTVSACPADVCRYGVTMSDAVLAQRAEALLALHQPGNPVVLPTVWDAWSATLAVSAGFAALTVGSHPVADSVGKPDGEGMSFDDLTTRVAQITSAVEVPVSVDIESGYGEAPGRLISGLLEAGAVGLLAFGLAYGLFAWWNARSKAEFISMATASICWHRSPISSKKGRIASRLLPCPTHKTRVRSASMITVA